MKVFEAIIEFNCSRIRGISVSEIGIFAPGIDFSDVGVGWGNRN